MSKEEFVNAAVQNAVQLGIGHSSVNLVVKKIEFGEDCWFWRASTKENGYGQMNISGKNWNAHRLVYVLAGGSISPGLELDHLCRVRQCVAPHHLEPVTRAVNVRRAADIVTHCPAGHEYNDENTYLWRGFRHCRLCRMARAKRTSNSGAGVGDESTGIPGT